MVHDIPEDIKMARRLFEEAESFSSNNKKFCSRFLEGLEILIDYLEEDQSPEVEAFVKNLIVTYSANLIRRFPKIDVTDPLVWMGYIAIIIKIPDDLKQRIYSENNGFKDIVLEFRDNWLDEFEKILRNKSS